MGCKETARDFVRVAVVDDDENTRVFLKDILQSAEGFGLVEDFSTASQALTEIPRLRPDLVMMDVWMLDLNGIECTKRLKETTPLLKIIIMTGTPNSDIINRLLQVGAAAHLTKPFTIDQCMATLKSVAGSHTEKRSESLRSRAECSRLNPQESEVLRLLAKGLLYKEISEELGISYAAVHKRQHKIFRKLQVSNRSEAIRKWLNSYLE